MGAKGATEQGLLASPENAAVVEIQSVAQNQQPRVRVPLLPISARLAGRAAGIGTAGPYITAAALCGACFFLARSTRAHDDTSSVRRGE